MSSLRKKGGEVTIKAPVGITDDVLLFENDLDGFPSALLTVSDVAKILKISTTSVRRLQWQGDIRSTKLGGSVRFLKDDVLAYVREQRAQAIG